MRYGRMYLWLLLFAAALIAVGLILGDPADLIPGLGRIMATQDVLITDYLVVGGPAAAFANAALVLLATLLVLWIMRDPINGFTIVIAGMMTGFAFFGKNIWNIWPTIFGTLLYARLRREPAAKYTGVALLSTALAPLVSYISHGEGWGNPILGILVGIGIGLVIAPLSEYTYKIQNGMNLYNIGFACGLLSLILVPLMYSVGKSPEPNLIWATGYNLPLGIALGVLWVVLILCGLFRSGKPVWAVWAGYRKLLQTTGRAPLDYLRMLGGGPLLMNMGVNGILSTAYILLIGGDLNGPTLGGIFAVVGFSAFGKHARNILPIMLGVVAGSQLAHWSLSDPAVQIAGLFCTTLAPISGHFGWPYGVLAGILHASVVLRAGIPAAGVNLYNNGFSGGLVATVLYPVLTNLARHRKPTLQNEANFELIETDRPMSPDEAEREGKEKD